MQSQRTLENSAADGGDVDRVEQLNTAVAVVVEKGLRLPVLM